MFSHTAKEKMLDVGLFDYAVERYSVQTPKILWSFSCPHKQVHGQQDIPIHLIHKFIFHRQEW